MTLKFVSGFTLLELLVAMAIFAVIATLAYSGLNTIVAVQSQVEHHAKELAQLQIAFARLEQDIEQIVERPIRDEYGEIQLSVMGQVDQLEFTRSGWYNPIQQQRSTLQRVAYYLAENKLWRKHWQVLDRAQDSSPESFELLTLVDELQWRFFDEKFNAYSEWPPQTVLPAVTSEHPVLVLTAIEITLVTRQWGRLTRLFRVALPRTRRTQLDVPF